jgi:hypothetical protein
VNFAFLCQHKISLQIKIKSKLAQNPTLGQGRPFFLKEGKDEGFLDGLGVLLEC